MPTKKNSSKLGQSSEPVRIQKIIADLGICSRREAERLIEDGEVTLNGKEAKLGDKAIPGKDHVKVRGKLLQVDHAPDRIVLAIFKPREMLTTRSDDPKAVEGTIFELIPNVKERVFPVGRLDKDAEGLVLVTNDGELSRRLMLGKYEIPKEYKVKIDNTIDEMRMKRLGFGVSVEDTKTKPMQILRLDPSEGKQWIRATTTETRNRMVRKAFEAVGRPVDKLVREKFGPISIKGLQRGEARYLNPDEIKALLKLVGMA